MKQVWVQPLLIATADATAVTGTSETAMFPDLPIDPTLLEYKDVITCRFRGKYSTTTGTNTVVFKLKINGTIILQTAAITLVASVTNGYFDIECEFVIRVEGASGTIIGGGVVIVFGATAPTVGSATGAPAIAPFTAGGQTAPAAVAALVLSSIATMTLTAQFNATGNSITGQMIRVVHD